MSARSTSSTAYSGTPLPRKLGLQPGTTLAWVDAPVAAEGLLGPLPESVRVRESLRGHADLVVCFVTERAVLARRVGVLRRVVAPDGAAWVAWPKRSSGVATDVTEDVVRELALPTGLVDVKVCAIDATWSGLKLVVRRELRGSGA
jgi:hypothetical protein